MVCVCGVHARGNGTGWFLIVRDVAEEGDGDASGGVGLLLRDFVADAPAEDRGVVSVSAEEGPEVGLVPVVEEAGVVVCGLVVIPHVEYLVHNEEAHAVGQFEEFGRRRVMRHADGVCAH